LYGRKRLEAGRGKVSGNLVQDAMINIALSTVSPSKDLRNQIEADLVTVVESGWTDQLTNRLVKNRLAYCASATISEIDSGAVRALQPRLAVEVARTMQMQSYRNSLLKTVCSLLEEKELDYVVFKTLNKSGAVGVDLDVMIDESDFDDCVRAFQNRGFRSIDDLSKRYATGFVLGTNPIVVDLHTSLTVLGVSYLSSASLLSSKRRIRYQSTLVDEPFDINLLKEEMDAIVRMAHCVIKEGRVSIADLIEPVKVMEKSLSEVAVCSNREGLQTAVNSFLRIYSTYIESFSNDIAIADGALARIARCMTERTLSSQRELPVKLPLMLSMAALLDRLRRKEEVTEYLLTPISSLRYRRNIEQLGRKILTHSL
jgi:hypothetical protein